MFDVKKIVAVLVVIAVSVVAVTFALQGGEENNEEYDYRNSITFYIFDNNENSNPIRPDVLRGGEHIANGIWVRGYGDTATECFKNACKTLDIPLTMAGDGLTTINGVGDGEFCHLGWYMGEWNKDYWLGKVGNTFTVKYMAIGHGLWKDGGYDVPPTVGTTPDDILWRYGENVDHPTEWVMRIPFYFYDNYCYDNAPPATGRVRTDKLIVDGFCVYGYGNSVSEAFKNACSRAYGNDKVSYDASTGIIKGIKNVSNNISSLQWNGSSWTECNLSSITYSDHMYIAIGHGLSSSEGIPPEPPRKPDEINWIL